MGHEFVVPRVGDVDPCGESKLSGMVVDGPLTENISSVRD